MTELEELKKRLAEIRRNKEVHTIYKEKRLKKLSPLDSLKLHNPELFIEIIAMLKEGEKDE